jgi:hypothetical protein
VGITVSDPENSREVAPVNTFAVTASSPSPSEMKNGKAEVPKTTEQERVVILNYTSPKAAKVSKPTDQNLDFIQDNTSSKTDKAPKTRKASPKLATLASPKPPAKARKQTSVEVSTTLAKTAQKKTIAKKTPAKTFLIDQKVKIKKSAPMKIKETPNPEKPLSENHVKLARFSDLLETFINSANALQDEFGGIPDQIRIVSERFGKHHGKVLGATAHLTVTNIFSSSCSRLTVRRRSQESPWPTRIS